MCLQQKNITLPLQYFHITLPLQYLQQENITLSGSESHTNDSALLDTFNSFDSLFNLLKFADYLLHSNQKMADITAMPDSQLAEKV